MSHFQIDQFFPMLFETYPEIFWLNDKKYIIKSVLKESACFNNFVIKIYLPCLYYHLYTFRDLPPELVGVSVKDLVKAIGESRANGNGITPPDTPRRLSRSSSPHVSRPTDSRSSSPVPIPGSAVQ